MRLALLLFFVCLTIALTAQTSIDFTGFDGSGISAPTPNGEAIVGGQLNGAVFSVDGFSAADDLTRGESTGGETTGGVYAFEVAAGNVALGVQPGGNDFTDGYFQLELYNQSGAAIAPTDMIDVSYTVYNFNDQSRGNSFNFAYSTDGSAFTDVPALDYTSPAAADATPAWVATSRMTTITGISVPAGAPFYIRFIGDDDTGSGSRDEFAVDDITVDIVSILPVTLSTLAAERMGKTAMVKWATATESGNSHFVVERSLDGRTFAEVGRVNGAGDSNGTINYDFVDQAPAIGANYYRLRQVDLTGASALFGPVLVSFDGEGITAYPNPVSDRLFVSGANEATQVSVIDLNGRVLSRTAVSGNGVATDRLAPGTYLLRVENAAGTETLRFVKQ
ncbi:T9SS type A sorting domain-containing protein [Neolewinella aurantiaca]|uniref:T9SS type A sorting domain-containing protein n=1 Tax=Neolewinella aurantiaca TaxID=2602767 RepID=A0A5C7FY07_9BACT|nr:T9SS type A sorting domain-containing protein [Neolewinella aurantiaca]TXF89910.1 T9SS type A sorting domain-containing protein [Neolewinella aurantiaca]